MSLAAYLDDSRADGIFVIAGYVARLDVWELLGEAWTAVLRSAKLTEFKAHECYHRSGQFKGWTTAERDALFGRLLDILCDSDFSPSLGIGAAVRIPQIADKGKRLQHDQRALVLALSDVVGSVLTVSHGESVEFICDHQPKQNGRFVDAHDSVREAYKQAHPDAELSHMKPEDSKRVVQLQTADLLAFETRKALRDKLLGVPQREALNKIIASGPHVAYYIDPVSVDLTMSRDAFGNSLLYASEPLGEQIAAMVIRDIPSAIHWPLETDDDFHRRNA